MFPLPDNKNVGNYSSLAIVVNFQPICKRARQKIDKKRGDNKAKCVFNDEAYSSHARTI